MNTKKKTYVKLLWCMTAALFVSGTMLIYLSDTFGPKFAMENLIWGVLGFLTAVVFIKRICVEHVKKYTLPILAVATIAMLLLNTPLCVTYEVGIGAWLGFGEHGVFRPIHLLIVALSLGMGRYIESMKNASPDLLEDILDYVAVDSKEREQVGA